MIDYCKSTDCEYNAGGCCEYPWLLIIDEGGYCMMFRCEEVANDI